MAMRKYKWNGCMYQIADEDLHLYPGAEPVEAVRKSSRPTKAELAKELTNPELYEAVEAKKAKEAENKAKAEPKNKRAPKKEDK